eukprot:1177679-Prorocentrum_minimum.AAC.2
MGRESGGFDTPISLFWVSAPGKRTVDQAPLAHGVLTYDTLLLFRHNHSNQTKKLQANPLVVRAFCAGFGHVQMFQTST